MCCESFWKRIVSFSLTLVFGLLAASSFQQETVENKTRKTYYFPKVVKTEGGGGMSEQGHGHSGNCSGEHSPKNKAFFPEKKSDSKTSGLSIFSKPRANYTEKARANNIQGNVILRVTFLANGEIGAIFPIKELPDGLTEQAIAAARKIKFEPAKRDGKPVTVTKPVEYSFTIY